MGNVESNIIDARSSYHFGNRLPRNPFDPVHPVEHLEWCRTCEMDVDVTVEAAHADGVDVYRKTCKRCGMVIQHGMARRHIDASVSKPLPVSAVNFIAQRGTDRR